MSTGSLNEGKLSAGTPETPQVINVSSSWPSSLENRILTAVRYLSPV